MDAGDCGGCGSSRSAAASACAGAPQNSPRASRRITYTPTRLTPTLRGPQLPRARAPSAQRPQERGGVVVMVGLAPERGLDVACCPRGELEAAPQLVRRALAPEYTHQGCSPAVGHAQILLKLRDVQRAGEPDR